MTRLPFIDWARGFAVVAMMLWHTGDGWLRLDQREGQLWLVLRFVGGLAAPSFIFLAGCAAALGARSPHEARARTAHLNALARGLEVWLLGYALRMQTWLLDAGALAKLGTLRAWLPIALGYTAMGFAFRRLAASPRHAARWAVLGLALAVLGFLQVESVAPGRLAKLLQVDVLQAIGASLCLLTLLQWSGGFLERPLWLFVASFAVAASTEALTRALPWILPTPVAAYFGRFAVPQGAPVPALFPLFPWFAYALAGAGWGAVLKRARGAQDRVVVHSALFGACLALITSEAQPFVHKMVWAMPWTAHPIRVGFRVGLVCVLLMVGWVWSGERRGAWWLSYGRNSLRIYWAHMLFAYGILGRALQKRADVWSWALWLLPLFGAMWLLTRLQGTELKNVVGNVRT